MKNIHILPTDKPSRLYTNRYGEYKLHADLYTMPLDSIGSNQNIYIISDEEIKGDDWAFDSTNYGLIHKVWEITETHFSFKDSLHTRGLKSINRNLKCHFKKIILTTDQDLIKDGVQAIDNEFLEWFVKNQSCERVEVEEGIRYEDEWVDNEDGGEIFQHQYCCYKIIIPKEETQLDHSGVHLKYCYQGEYEDSCKYGDDDCPVNKIKQRAKNYMSLKDALEPKDVILGYKTSLYAQIFDKFELEETLEEAAEKYGIDIGNQNGGTAQFDFINGAKWQKEKMYSEEDLLSAFEAGMKFIGEDKGSFKEWFENFKKK